MNFVERPWRSQRCPKLHLGEVFHHAMGLMALDDGGVVTVPLNLAQGSLLFYMHVYIFFCCCWESWEGYHLQMISSCDNYMHAFHNFCLRHLASDMPATPHAYCECPMEQLGCQRLRNRKSVVKTSYRCNRVSRPSWDSMGFDGILQKEHHQST